MAKKDEALLNEFRRAPCEWCNRPAPSHAAHILAKGYGGWARLDLRINLVSLCAKHHSEQHGGNGPTRGDMLAIVAKREGMKNGGTVYLAILDELQKTRGLSLRDQARKPPTKQQLQQRARAKRAAAARLLKEAEKLEASA